MGRFDDLTVFLRVIKDGSFSAAARMLRALKETDVVGIKTTADLHHFLLSRPSFQSGEINTAFVAKVLESGEF